MIIYYGMQTFNLEMIPLCHMHYINSEDVIVDAIFYDCKDDHKRTIKPHDDPVRDQITQIITEKIMNIIIKKVIVKMIAKISIKMITKMMLKMIVKKMLKMIVKISKTHDEL